MAGGRGWGYKVTPTNHEDTPLMSAEIRKPRGLGREVLVYGVGDDVMLYVGGWWE